MNRFTMIQCSTGIFTIVQVAKDSVSTICSLIPLWIPLVIQQFLPLFTSFLVRIKIAELNWLVVSTCFNQALWKKKKIKVVRHLGWWHSIPIGSMYAIYGNIYHQYTPDVSIYTIHGSYGQVNGKIIQSWSSHQPSFQWRPPAAEKEAAPGNGIRWQGRSHHSAMESCSHQWVSYV